MELTEAKEILKKNGFIVEDVSDFSDDEQDVSQVAKEKIQALAERLSEEGFKVNTGISWAGPFVEIKKTKIGPVGIVYEEEDNFFTVECNDGGQVYLKGDYEEEMPYFVGFLNGKNNF